MVVELYRSGQPVKQLSSEYGVSEVTVYKWIKLYSPITSVDEDEITLEEILNITLKMNYYPTSLTYMSFIQFMKMVNLRNIGFIHMGF